MYFLMSFMLCGVIVKANDVFISMFFVIAMQMVFIALTILLEFSHLILSPDDYPILAPHPVNSRTFFAAKALHFVIYVTMMVVALGLAPAIATAIRHGSILLFPLTFLASWSAGMAAAMAFALFYTAMLRLGNRERMHRYLSYLQLLMMFFIYGGYVLLPEIGRKIIVISNMGVDRTYFLLTPPGWFASWPALLKGDFSMAQVWAAGAGVVSLVAMYLLGISKLSFQYAQTLNETVEQQQGETESRRAGILGRVMQIISTPEDRVVWKLMRKQFKYDNRYKLSVLMIVPLTLMYLYNGMKDGKALTDPFAIGENPSAIGTNVWIYVALALLPYIVVIGTSNSTFFRAAWAYYVSPADRTKLVQASNRFAIIFFCIPYLIFLGILMTYFFGNAFHALLHCVVLFLLLLVLVGMFALISPRIPFSEPPKSGQRVGAMMLAMFVSIPTVVVPMAILTRTGYGGAIGYSTVVFTMLLLVAAMSFLQKRFIPRRLAKQEFIDT